MWKPVHLNGKHSAMVLGALALAMIMVGAPAIAKRAPAHTAIPAQDMVRPPSFADLVSAVSPAVVNISTTGKSPVPSISMPDFQLPPDSPFQDFLEKFFNEYGGSDGTGKQPEHKFQAVGSGFIVDPSGYVVTNHHVIKGADEITVILHDGKRVPAKLRGFDAKTDLALLKIDTDKELPYVVFGDSDHARVGDWVIAIGNPFGLGGSATTGIISARGRDIQSGPLDDFLQIDAPINRGNSGGPLFDATGRVIGVNTAIYSPNGGNVGIGFAIPALQAKPVIDQLIASGHVERGWLGVQIQHIGDDLAEGLGLKKPKGALVTDVVAGSPAEKAGLKTGDVIVEYNGKDVDHMRALPRLVAETNSGTTVALKVWRSGKMESVNVRIGSSPEDKQVASAGGDNGSGTPASTGELGLLLATITPELRERYGLPDDAQGVVVLRVKRGSPAAQKGLRPGDVIKRVGDTPVSDPSEVASAIKSRGGKGNVLMLVARKGNDRFVALRLS